MNIRWLPENLRIARIFGIDAFRGVAALLVFVFHFYTMFLNNVSFTMGNDIDWYAFLGAGHLGINIFFVLSGFLIFLSFLNCKSVGKYFRRRFLRLVPLALVYVLVIFWWNGNYDEGAWWDMGAHLLFVQSFFTETYHGGFPVMWTLSLEMLFYAFIPIFFWLTKRSKTTFWFVLLGLVGANFWYRGYVSQFFVDWTNFERIFHSEQLWGRFDQFALGMILGYLHVFRDTLKEKFKNVSGPLIWLGLVGFGLSYYAFGVIGSSFRNYLVLQLFFHSIVGLFFCVFLYGFMNTKNTFIKNLFAPNWLEYVGKISYGVYLWHFPVLYALQQWNWDPFSAFFTALAATLVLSMLTWYLVEQPFLSLKWKK